MNTTPKENEIKYIREALNQFNKEIVGDDGHTPLNIIEYDENGNIIGGILGGTYWGWMYVDILWVHASVLTHMAVFLCKQLFQITD